MSSRFSPNNRRHVDRENLAAAIDTLDADKDGSSRGVTAMSGSSGTQPCRSSSDHDAIDNRWEKSEAVVTLMSKFGLSGGI